MRVLSSVIAAAAVVAVVGQESTNLNDALNARYPLTQATALEPEWFIPGTPMGNGIRRGATAMLGGKDHYANELGGTTDPKEESINMTPYVRQTKDEKWEAGVPNYEAPEEGYFIRTFPVESDARTWVIEKTAADNTINYPMAPDVEEDDNPANPQDPNDKNPNTMQDGAPTRAPPRKKGHLEPAYVGEYDEDEIFGKTIEGDHGGDMAGRNVNADAGDKGGILWKQDKGASNDKGKNFKGGSFYQLKDRRNRAFKAGRKY